MVGGGGDLFYIGVNATGDAGDASPAIFGEPGTKCLISPPPKACQNCYQP